MESRTQTIKTSKRAHLVEDDYWTTETETRPQRHVTSFRVVTRGTMVIYSYPCQSLPDRDAALAVANACFERLK